MLYCTFVKIMWAVLGTLQFSDTSIVNLQQALVGEDLAERQLFSSSSGLADDSICSDFDMYVRKLQVYCWFFHTHLAGCNYTWCRLLLSKTFYDIVGSTIKSFTIL